MSDETYQSSQPQPSVEGEKQAIQCPACASPQFFGGRKTSTWGWLWLIGAILNLLVSVPLMFVGIGFATVILTPLMMIGFHVCKRHVNTCARCKKEF